MAYNDRVARVMTALGVKRLPVGGMPEREVEGVKVWVAALPPRPQGSCFKRSTHRLLCECPRCGKAMSFGRLAQHEGTAACEQLRMFARAGRAHGGGSMTSREQGQELALRETRVPADSALWAARAVPCPACKVEAGRRCTYVYTPEPRGKEMVAVHRDRYLAAGLRDPYLAGEEAL